MKNRSKAKYFIIVALTLCLVGVGYYIYTDMEKKRHSHTDKIPEDTEVGGQNEVLDGIHVSTGLVAGEGLSKVVQHCTACHSSKLIIQNRMTKEQWNATIRWMQESQGLWDLGDDQKIIVDYLTENYPIYRKGRREALSDIDWYYLKKE